MGIMYTVVFCSSLTPSWQTILLLTVSISCYKYRATFNASVYTRLLVRTGA